MAKKLASVNTDDMASESSSNMKKSQSKQGIELKITVEGSSMEECAIPMIDDRIKTRRGGLRNAEKLITKMNKIRKTFQDTK